MRLDFECYAVFDKKKLFGTDLKTYLTDLVVNGVNIIEFKNYSLDEVAELTSYIKDYDVKKFVFNDFEILNELNLDGIHVDKVSDEFLKCYKIKGVTVNNYEELETVNELEINYIYIKDNIRKLAINSKHIVVAEIESNKISSYKASMIDGVAFSDNYSYDPSYEVNKIKNEARKLVFHPNDFELFIFDYDGTLLDSMPTWRNVGSLYLKEKGLSPNDSFDEKLEYISNYEAAKIIVEDFKLDMSVLDVLEDMNSFVERFYPHLGLKNRAVELLNSASGHASVVLCSATPSALLNPSLKATKLNNRFNYVYSTSDLRLSKEDGSAFNHVLDNEDAEVKRTIVVEDSINAIISCNKLGIKTLAIEDSTNKKYIDKIMEYATYYYTLERLAK